MTNLLTVLPDFDDIKSYTHILPSLEKAQISCADLLTLDANDVAKRAQVPPTELRKLCAAVLERLSVTDTAVSDCASISWLDDKLDEALGGGVRAGNLTELVGESAAGKTQFLLTLLLSVQLQQGKSALYISTEAPLQTARLTQILEGHPKLRELPKAEKPSLSRIQSTHIHDLEAQDHILRYQVPVVIKRHNIGLLVIDSIAANYRPEFDKGKARKTAAESFVKRSNQVAQLGELLRKLAQTYNIAVVVANQVADRFAPEHAEQVPFSQQTQRSRPGSPALPTAARAQVSQQDPPPRPPQMATDDPLSLDHQQRFFTGWGDDTSVTNLKTPSLGLAWTNQLAARIALLKEPVVEMRPYKPGEEPTVSGWRRRLKVVFSSWCEEGCTEFEIVEGGVRAKQVAALDEDGV